MNSLDTYLCCICTELMSSPWTISTCRHSTCENCMKTLLASNLSCPICRKAFTRQDVQLDRVLSDKINTATEQCICGKVLSIVGLKDHMDVCQQVAEDDKMAKSNLLHQSKMKKVVNRSTFICPVCKLENLTRADLLTHAESKHPGNRAVCPICVTQPWGDPNYITHLSGHLKLRHKYSFDTYTDYEKEDDAILQQVIELSRNETRGKYG